MKRTLLIAAFVLTGCSSVTPIPDHPVVYDYGEGCRVTVYQTETDALRRGAIVERCVIDGTSSKSWTHTPEVAIEKHARKACECNTDKVFVQSRSPNVLGVASVSMVAFEWVD